MNSPDPALPVCLDETDDPAAAERVLQLARDAAQLPSGDAADLLFCVRRHDRFMNGGEE